MKKIIGVITLILTTVVVGIFLINGKKENTDVTKEQTKVGVLLIGNCDDKSYSQSHYEGIEKISKKLKISKREALLRGIDLLEKNKPKKFVNVKEVLKKRGVDTSDLEI